ncbi:hypothetical protein ACJIZ3_001335 [Penstemon smallii]|uniref:Uncharacterized protein n=1 Tax=Penstemon smallii TaxID=265156 RepID=A0ABD3U3G2_9LAMI
MVSDSKLVERLREILRVSDLETTTANVVRRRLEEEFSVDLLDRRAFIREQIDLFLQEKEEVIEYDSIDAAVEEEEQKEVKEEENESEIESESENENENESEEEESDADRRKRKKSKSAKMDSEVKKKGGGFTKPCALSPQLEKLLGVSELARTQVVKKIWEYIRENNLQNPKDKRKIICDDSLREVFRVNSIDMFQMNKVLSKHIWPLDEVVKSSQKERQRQPKQDEEVDSDEAKRKEKPKKGGGSGLTAPLPLSDALVKFFGTGENELSRVDVVKKMWQYIKENELQDPSDKRMVICDDKLKELFEVDSFRGFGVSKLLTPHFMKTEG